MVIKLAAGQPELHSKGTRVHGDRLVIVIKHRDGQDGGSKKNSRVDAERGRRREREAVRERVGGCLRWRLLAEDVWGADGISTGSAGVAGQAQWQTRQAGADDTAAREYGSTRTRQHERVSTRCTHQRLPTAARPSHKSSFPPGKGARRQHKHLPRHPL